MSQSSTLLLPKIFTGMELVQNTEFLDIDFSTMNYITLPNVSASVTSDKHGTSDTGNINIFITNLTKNTARINFSSNFVGTVNYTVIGFI